MNLSTLEQTYNIKILPINIMGRRWSFAGGVMTDLPLGEQHRIKINEKNGFIVYNWNTVNKSQQEQIENELRTQE